MKIKIKDLTHDECVEICHEHTCSNCPLFNNENFYPLNCYKDFKIILDNKEAFKNIEDKEIEL